EADERHRRPQEEPVGRFERRLVGILGGSGRRATAVPDKDVEAAEAVDRGRYRPLEVGILPHVAGDRDTAEPFRVLLELLLASGEQDDVRTLLRQRLGARQAEARRRAADERRAAAQSEIHESGNSPALATTRVVMPPRAANSPSTSTKRGAPSATSCSSAACSSSERSSSTISSIPPAPSFTGTPM